MIQSFDIHGAKSIVISDYKSRALNGDESRRYTVMTIDLIFDDQSRTTISLFGDNDGIAFSAPGLECRPCAECGNLMPRDYHPRVTVCSVCETKGAPLAHVE